MSNSTEFCQCCSASDELVLLQTRYRNIIKSYYDVKIRDGDCHICATCVAMLIDIEMFRRQIINTQEYIQEIKLPSQHVIPSTTNSIENDDDNGKKITVNLMKAELTKNGVWQYQCAGKQEFIQMDLNDYINSTQFASDNSIVTLPSENNFQCRGCGEQFVSDFSLRNHMKDKCPEYICEVCGKGFLSAYSVQRHIKTHELKPIPCKNCGLTFENYQDMRQHRKEEHWRNYRHTCRVCRKRFIKLEEKKQHLADEHGLIEKKYECSMCPAAYLMHSKLAAHIRYTHQKGKRKYTCHICHSTYKQKPEYTEHMRTHTGERPFQCELCDKAFTRKSCYVVHKRIHAQDKRYKCEVCSMGFVQAHALKNHMKVHGRDVFS